MSWRDDVHADRRVLGGRPVVNGTRPGVDRRTGARELPDPHARGAPHRLRLRGGLRARAAAGHGGQRLDLMRSPADGNVPAAHGEEHERPRGGVPEGQLIVVERDRVRQHAWS